MQLLEERGGQLLRPAPSRPGRGHRVARHQLALQRDSAPAREVHREVAHLRVHERQQDQANDRVHRWLRLLPLHQQIYRQQLPVRDRGPEGAEVHRRLRRERTRRVHGEGLLGRGKDREAEGQQRGQQLLLLLHQDPVLHRLEIHPRETEGAHRQETHQDKEARDLGQVDRREGEDVQLQRRHRAAVPEQDGQVRLHRGDNLLNRQPLTIERDPLRQQEAGDRARTQPGKNALLCGLQPRQGNRLQD